MAFPNELRKLFVDSVPRAGQRALILLGGIASPHDAKIRRPRADVDDHRMQKCFQSVSDRKRLGHQHHGVCNPVHSAT